MELDKVANALKLLGDKTRLSIIALLQYGECCVCEFVALFEMSQPSISQHLRKLRDAGVVKERRQGQWVFYALNKETSVYPLIQELLKHIPDQTERLAELEAKGFRITCE